MNKFLLSLLLLIGTAAQAGPPLTWGPDNKVLLFQGGLEIPQVASPAGSPATGYNYLYFKSDNILYQKTSAGVESAVGGAAAAGDVVGPASSTADAIAVYNGTTGKLLKNSAVTISGSTVTGSLTGAASLNVLKAGDTMTGALVNSVAGAASTPGVLLSGAPYSAGNATTNKPQLLVETSGATSTAWHASGTEVGVNTASGFAGDFINIQKNGVKRFSVDTTGVMTLGNPNNTRQVVFDYSSAGSIYIGKSISEASITISDAAITGGGTSWINISGSGSLAPIAWPQGSHCISAAGNVTLLSAIKPLDGAAINGAPWWVMANANANVNTLAGFVTTGTSKKPMSFVGTRHITQTSSSEDSDLMLANQNAGTLEEHIRIKPKGQVVHLGTAPAAGTCGTSPGTPTGNDNFFKITSGTGGSSGTCAVTLATAPTTAGNCVCRDKTTVATTVDADVSGSTVTMTTYSRTTGLAANFAASDVFECQCKFF